MTSFSTSSCFVLSCFVVLVYTVYPNIYTLASCHPCTLNNCFCNQFTLCPSLTSCANKANFPRKKRFFRNSRGVMGQCTIIKKVVLIIIIIKIGIPLKRKKNILLLQRHFIVYQHGYKVKIRHIFPGVLKP